MINLYDLIPLETKGRDIHSPLPYLIFKTSKQPSLSSHSSPSSPFTPYSPPPPNFGTHRMSIVRGLNIGKKQGKAWEKNALIEKFDDKQVGWDM